MSGGKLIDLFPQYLTLTGAINAPTGWSCQSEYVTSGSETRVRLSVKCETNNLLLSGSVHSFVVPVQLADDAPNNAQMGNIAYICEKNIPDGSGGTKPNPLCPTTVNPPPECKDLPPEEQKKDPACIKVDNGFDLSLRKYIDSNDAETAIDLAQGANFNYRIVVTNNGEAAVRGTTFISDTFPTGVERTLAAITTNGWTCS